MILSGYYIGFTDVKRDQLNVSCKWLLLTCIRMVKPFMLPIATYLT
jgi:hypothetical protein